MNDFPLKIVTPDGVAYDGTAQALTLRTASGDMGILAGHINCIAPVGMGQATILCDGVTRRAACIGGLVSVLDGKVTLVPTTFEWEENIDLDRAESSKQRAEAVLHSSTASKTDLLLAEARLKRALVRTSLKHRK